MKKILGKVAVILAAFSLTFVGLSAPAMADKAPCDPQTSATGCMDPAACEYERWHSDGCNNPWTISIAQECKQLWADNSPWVKSDPVCRKYAPPRKWHPKTVTVRRGMTLWRVAVICYGYKYSYHEKAGHLWPKVAKRNHVKGKTIRVGQRLSC